MDEREPRLTRLRLGAALGAASGPAIGLGATWSGIGDGRPHVWLLATAVGALLGALAWPLFQPRDLARPTPGSGFAALFGAAVGLLAGALTAFPMGGVTGALGGAAGGASAHLAWRLMPARLAATGPWRPLAAAAIGIPAGLLVAWWVTA